ncbi:MAG TPA: hypothetical protein VMX12_12995 [Acidimicrobiia bacterium]|nr:hypothetical protein [Acidimicrobiia bacterium]
MEIYAPEGAQGTPPASLAPPHSALEGKRIGILDNLKPNAGLLLGRMAERIAERTGAVVTVVETKNAAVAAPDQVLRRLTKEVELVLTGSAD